MAQKHPFQVGTQIRSIEGEEDGNGSTKPGAIGEVVKHLGDLGGRQGHAYDVRFPMDVQAKQPDVDDATAVFVVLDQGDSVDDTSKYEVVSPVAPEGLSANERRLVEAAMSGSFPVNSRPFLAGLEARLVRMGTNTMLEQRAKDDVVIQACMLILVGQFAGQLATYSTNDQWDVVSAKARALGITGA